MVKKNKQPISTKSVVGPRTCATANMTKDLFFYLVYTSLPCLLLCSSSITCFSIPYSGVCIFVCVQGTAEKQLPP